MSEYNEDFDNIQVTEVSQRDDGWTFLVELGYGEGALEYMVDVDREYWTSLTGRRLEPDKLVEVTFQFLMQRGSKETIKKKFNLAEISGTHPNYDIEIKRLL